MYFLDPDRGRRRRALAADKTVRWRRKAREAAGATTRDLRNRAQGMAAEVRSWVVPEGPVDDTVVAERIRAVLGFVTRHPSAIDVEVRNGVATIGGPVLSKEAPGVLAAVRGVRGVTHIENRLALHEDPSGVPALQGGSPRVGPRFELFQRHWSPAGRAAAAAAGATAVGAAFRRRSLARGVVAIAGLALLLRALVNRELADIAAPLRAAVPPSSGRRDEGNEHAERWKRVA